MATMEVAGWTWSAPSPLAELQNTPTQPLVLAVGREHSDGTMHSVLRVPLPLDRVAQLDVYLSSRTETLHVEVVRAAFEEIAAFVQSWGDEYAPLADAIRERWAAKSTLVPIDVPVAGDHVGQHEDCETCERALAAMPQQIQELRAALSDVLKEIENGFAYDYHHKVAPERIAAWRRLVG